MTSKPSPSLWLLLAVAGVQQTIMGGTFPFARHVLQLIDPLAVAFFRYCLSSSILCLIFIIVGRRRSIPIEKPDRRKILVLGIIIILLNQTLFLIGQRFTTAAHGGLLFTLTPIFVYLLAMKYLKETWSNKKGAGILLAMVGSGIIILENGLVFNLSIFKGDIIIIGAVIAWAYYTVLGKPLVEKYGALKVTAYGLGTGTLIYFPFGLYRFLAVDLSRVDTLGWISLLYISILTSVIGYVIWYWLLKYMEASRVSVLVNIQPVIASIVGFYLLQEPITIPFLIGGLIILTGVTITQRA